MFILTANTVVDVADAFLDLASATEGTRHAD